MESADDPANPDAGNPINLNQANAYYREARAIFMDHGELDKARIVAEAADQTLRETLMLPAINGHGAHQPRATGASKQ